MKCKYCHQRFGIAGVNYWSCQLGVCPRCKEKYGDE